MAGLVARPSGSLETERQFILEATSLEGRHIEVVIQPSEAYGLMQNLNQFLRRNHDAHPGR